MGANIGAGAKAFIATYHFLFNGHQPVGGDGLLFMEEQHGRLTTDRL